MPIFSPKNAQKVQKLILFFIGRGQEIRPLFCDFWIARWLNLICGCFYFVRFRPSSGGQSGTKRKNFGSVPFPQKFEFFQNSWNTVCVSVNTTCGAIFSKIGPYLGELGPQKTPKWPISWMLQLPRNFFKIYNLRTTNAIQMKLGMIVYLHDTFHFTKDLGVMQRSLGGVAGKPLKKWVFWLHFSNFQKYIKNLNICDTSHYTTSLVKVLWKSDLIRGCNVPKTTQKQPKIPLFAGTRNFRDI